MSMICVGGGSGGREEGLDLTNAPRRTINLVESRMGEGEQSENIKNKTNKSKLITQTKLNNKTRNVFSR